MTRLISKWTVWATMVLICALPKVSAAQLKLYDNFNSSRIDPAKWNGWQFFDPDIREATRELTGEGKNRRLHVRQIAYASTADDSGGSGDLLALAFPDPATITEVSFTATVNQAKAVACSSNFSSQIVTDAEFRGNFFNVQDAPTSPIGDVVAVISVARSPEDVGDSLTVAGFYSVCDDQFCGAQTSLDYHVLGHVRPGVTSTLRIKWDPPNHQFVFQLNHEPEVVSAYTVSDASPPFFPNKIIGSARVVPHCTTSPRPFTLMDAAFDDVRTNR